MPHTAPVPNIVPIPGMDPGEAVAAGGAGSGGDDGNAGDGGDKEGAGGGKGGDDASGDNRDAPDPEKYPTCGTESHPVDVVTGRVFTHPIIDLELPGPLPLRLERSYSSKACREDQGLGLGWAHSFGWFVQLFRDRVRVWNQLGVSVSFPIPQIGHTVLGDWGWVVRREANGFAVDANDDVWRFFEATFDEGATYRLTAIQDRNKNRIALSYDAAGKLVQVTDSVGRIVKVTSTKDGRIGSIEVKNAEHQGRWIAFARYQYDDKGRLVRVTDADDYSWNYEYDEFNRLVRDTDRCGLSFCFRYDAQDRGIEAWGEYVGKRDPSLADDLPKYLADGTTRAKGIYHRKFDYHPRGYTEVTDTTETRRYFGNRKGTLDKAVTGGAITTSRYDERGFEIEKTDPLGATWRWVRDQRGRVIEAVDPLGRRTCVQRDEQGLPTRILDPAGGETRVWRDRHGNLETVKDAADRTTQLAYDERGLLTHLVDAADAATRCEYDGGGNLITVVQANGGRWTMTYDAFGRRLSIRDPAGGETRLVYSDRGDILAAFDAVGGVTRYTYDGERHLTQVVSPKGHTTRFGWGGFHKLCWRQDANGHVVRLAYGREGELVAVVNEREEVHHFVYDSAGRLIEERTFDERVLRYRNDAVGRAVRIENGAGEITKLLYDLAGQLVGRQLSDDTEETFTYDARGDIVTAANAAGEVRFERDAVGRILREVQRVAGEEHWIARTYDGIDRRIATRTSLGHTQTVQRDVMGARVRTVLDGTLHVDHVTDVLAREVRRILPSGGIIDSAFDAMGRLVQRAARSPSTARAAIPGEPDLLSDSQSGMRVASYAYDADGQLTYGNADARGPTRFEYDGIGQLLALVPEKARAEVFRYDPAGNVFEANGSRNERTYGKGNRLLRQGDTEYTWDEDGRLVRKTERGAQGARVWTYAWNGAGLLAAVGSPDGRVIEFAYDAFARRVRKSVRAGDDLANATINRTRFVWDGDALAHAIKSGSTHDPVVEERSYVFEDGSFAPVAHRDSQGAWLFYVDDPIGTPTALVDGSGAITTSVERSAWGLENAAETGGTSLAFPNQQEDEETGLAYNLFRYYDPSSGRFISPDPIGLHGGTNDYTYAPNAILGLDPYGLTGGVGPVQQGQAGVAQSAAAATARGATVIGSEITVVTPSGVRTRLDLMALQNGQLQPIEAKKGPNARLTKNQRKAFPEIAAKGCTAVGGNAAAAGIAGPLPPMTVRVDHW